MHKSPKAIKISPLDLAEDGLCAASSAESLSCNPENGGELNSSP